MSSSAVRRNPNSCTSSAPNVETPTSLTTYGECASPGGWPPPSDLAEDTRAPLPDEQRGADQFAGDDPGALERLRVLQGAAVRRDREVRPQQRKQDGADRSRRRMRP